MFVTPGESTSVVVCTDCGGLVARSAETDHLILHVALSFLGELVSQDVEGAREVQEVVRRRRLQPVSARNGDEW